VSCGVCQSNGPCGCGETCQGVVFPFRRVIGIKATADGSGAAQFMLPRQSVFDRLGFDDAGVLTAMRLYVDKTDQVTARATMFACEQMDGGNLDGPNNSFSGAAAAQWLLAESLPSALPVVKDGQTIACAKILGSTRVPFELGLWVAVRVQTLQGTPAFGLCSLLAVVEGYTTHRCRT
jgi:hypothetical protein